jgi:HlyD family secretion protein
MRKNLLIGVGLATLAVGAVVAVLVRAAVAPEDVRPRADGRLDVVRVVRRDLGYVVKATGVIKPMIGAEVRVGSRISGVVRRLFVRVGDRVRKGDLLAELDDRELVARRGEAAAALEVARANVSYTLADLRRRRELAAARLVSPSDLDLAERAYAVAEQQRTQAEASLEYATTQTGYARIHAPIAGVVASVSTQEGETVAASFATPTFVTLLDLSRLEVWAYVDETDIGRVRTGQRVHFTVDTYGDHEFRGQVSAVYPQAQIRDNVVNYVTVVKFRPPSDRTLRPEMTAAVRIALETRRQVLTLPLRAVRREAGRAFVWQPRGETFERRWIATGSRDDNYWEIVDGLEEGDEVTIGDVKVNEDGRR